MKAINIFITICTLCSCATFGGRKQIVNIQTQGHVIAGETYISVNYHYFYPAEKGDKEDEIIQDALHSNAVDPRHPTLAPFKADPKYNQHVKDSLEKSKIFSSFSFENKKAKNKLELDIYSLAPYRGYEKLWLLTTIVSLGLIPFRYPVKFRLEAKLLINGKEYQYRIEDENVSWGHLIFLPFVFPKGPGMEFHMLDEILEMIAKDLPNISPKKDLPVVQ